MVKNKFYTVWKGRKTGVFDSWNECKKQIFGFDGAQYKGFASKNEAECALKTSYWNFVKKTPIENEISIENPSVSVDAACSGNPGDMEYRGVWTDTEREIFHSEIYKNGTNNIGEFLAIVHALTFLKEQKSTVPIYSDSVNALIWIKSGKCKTKLKKNEQNEKIFDLIEKAENWLKANPCQNRIVKWNTEKWGEIPADFGRK
jgi:ribonuclease HI